MRAAPKAVLTAWFALGCGQTGIELIHPEASTLAGGAGGTSDTGGTGGGGSGGDAGGAGSVGGGGTDGNGTAGAAGEGGGGLGGGTGQVDCSNGLSTLEPGFVRIRNEETGLCLGQGESTEIGGEPAYEVVLVECTGDASQLWQLRVAGSDSYEVRNVAVAMNLDMQYAGTADGTPAVLFRPHLLDNQRFSFLTLPGGGFWMSPGNVLFGGVRKCLRENGSGVELRPCAPGDQSETFRVLDGLCY